MCSTKGTVAGISSRVIRLEEATTFSMIAMHTGFATTRSQVLIPGQE